MKKDFLGWAALVAALVGTASAEYQLAIAVGFGPVLAGCVPAALDVYALRAFKTQRDVPAVVVALILVNAAAHLVASGLLPVGIPLVIAVSAIAPLVLWRVHALGVAPEPVSAPESIPQPAAEAIPVTAPERTAERPTEPLALQPTAPLADPLLPDARKLMHSTGKPPTLRALQAELRIGQARAQRLRAALAE
ncbi:hypothetical protein ACN6K6_007459 [Streptomyces violaceoruber]|uniref:hypothetical protein n=1 Tax=Streptomyces violaceoruber TaxID=1935 RepID=UPI00403C9C89